MNEIIGMVETMIFNSPFLLDVLDDDDIDEIILSLYEEELE